MITFSITILIISCNFNVLDSFYTFLSKPKALNFLKLKYHHQKINNLFAKSYSELRDRIAPQDNVRTII